MNTAEEKKEKKVLWFFEEDFEKAKKDLHRMCKDVDNQFIAAWKAQPILKDEPFTQAHFDGIIAQGADYIRDYIISKVKAAQEKSLPGLSQQIKTADVELVGIDSERINRFASSFASPQPGVYSDRIHHAMIFIAKNRAVIAEDTLQQLKSLFTVYDRGDTREFFELGKIGEVTLTRLQALLDERQSDREKKLGMNLQHGTKIFVDKSSEGANNQYVGGAPRGLFYKDKTGWKFNPAKIII